MGLTELLLVLAVGGGIVAVLFATFKGAASEAETGPDGEAEASARRVDLEERQEAALRSLEEIEADYEAGNLSEADYEQLRRRYAGAAARLSEELVASESEARSPTREPTPGRRTSGMTTTVAWVAGTIAFIALAWLVMSTALRPRSENDTITGSLPGQDEARPAGMPVAEVDREQLAELERIVRDEPDNVEALVALGHLYLRMQQYPSLAEVTRRALVLDPRNPEALTHLGMLLFSTEHPQGVIASFDSALAIDPNFAEALQFKGMVSYMFGDYPTAVEAWDRYMEVVPAEEVSPRIKAMLESARASAGGGG
ncbi:MAG: hypothetical protein JSU87_05330 [Gemmatimonadota bacterium]|nr:MAG: hypothetical protein JSU87_05330 [Gemmatimonadota bacterium]